MPTNRIAFFAAPLGALVALTSPPATAQTIEEVTAAPTGVLEGVCHLSTERRTIFTKSFSGSAIVYRERYLITAAHNVFSPWYNPITSLSAVCGRADAGSATHREIPLNQSRVACGYGWIPKRLDRDYAVLRLDSPVAVSTPMQLRAFAKTNPLTAGVTLAGYPGANRRYRRMNAERLFVARGTGGFAANGPYVDYSFDTFRGNSGGPVWVTEGSQPRLLGIHISGGRARMADTDFVTEVEQMIESLENGTDHCDR